ncbi:MAG: hypothetical protein KME35_05220 [Aphanocapsa sp. GSE-SYN-MK-11-07L]|jgi:drug/metabolite transporter (DMT)-like permease|nr:hypothetical protein [Aphanocapsa sp. GSE-SYN-MK-11-07L]
MSFFNSQEPLLRKKQTALDVQDLEGLLHFDWRWGNFTLFAAHYTRIDQIFLLWGLLSAGIFTVAQFLPIAWATQAIYWSLLTIAVMAAMVIWSWYWTGVERLRWLIWLWVSLIGGGVLLTDWGIYTYQPWIMAHLCQFWLSVCAAGYILTGFGLRSRCLHLMAIAHFLGCGAIIYLPNWQFLLSGIVMGASLLLLGEYQWDMRSPSQFALLSQEQIEFNQQQHELRLSLESTAHRC